MSFRFGPEARLRSRKDFAGVFSAGRKTVGKNIILWRLDARSGGPSRLGLSMSAKVGPAVLRNRLKRLARETFRLNRTRLRPGQDQVLYFRRGCSWTKFNDAQTDLLALWDKAGMLA